MTESPNRFQYLTPTGNTCEAVQFFANDNEVVWSSWYVDLIIYGLIMFHRDEQRWYLLKRDSLVDGDWIVKPADGGYYRVNDSEFQRMYKKVMP